uniref:Ubiquitin-like domain-containing protein n=1 Tax=Aegilops tauschii subsp. strangulata TaxID=200361 RepID=A0A452XCB7_AEGTS
MTDGGPEAAPLEFPSAEWRRVYDRLQGLLPRVEALAADRARLEEAIKLSDAREKSLHARLLQAEASRERWKAAYTELPPGANPKLAELQERDLVDSEAREALPDVDNSQLKCTKLTNEMHLQRCTMQIFVKINCSIFLKKRKTHCLKTITLEVMRSNTIYDVKEKIQDKEGIPAVQQRLMFGSELLVDSCCLEDYNIVEESTLTLDLVPQGMHIFIRARSGKIMTIGVDGEDSLYSVKAKFFDETGIPPGRQRLFFAGKQLEDGRTLADYDVQNESTLHVAFRGITRRSGQMRISVRTVTGKKVIERAMKRRQAVDNIKAWIYSELCILPEEQQLSGEDGAPLAEVIRRSCIVVLQIRPPGGW